MSVIQKCADYAASHGGELPPFEKMDELVSEQLGEYLEKLSKAVIPDFDDRAIITAAYRLLYESRYGMLEPDDKLFCDSIVKKSVVVSTERMV